ncbi:hypothetical protein D3C81_1526510 [compost metagenome]
MPRHMEQPASRHSKPASMKVRSIPSTSACRLTSPEPGTTSAWVMLLATRLPKTSAAAMRRSSIRAFVQEPMNTLSRRISRIAVPGSRPMYFRARVKSRRITGSDAASGSGTWPSMLQTISGEVPQVTCGRTLAASSSSSRSKSAAASLCRVRQ